jgi:hypothetical protein
VGGCSGSPGFVVVATLAVGLQGAFCSTCTPAVNARVDDLTAFGLSALRFIVAVGFLIGAGAGLRLLRPLSFMFAAPARKSPQTIV